MIIALASPRVASSLEDGLDRVKRLVSEASAQHAEIVCFPEAYLPGLRGQDFDALDWGPAEQSRVLETVAEYAQEFEVAILLGLEKIVERGRQIVTVVIDSEGKTQGFQTKNQLDPTEDGFYVPGGTRQLFEINGVKFGI